MIPTSSLSHHKTLTAVSLSCITVYLCFRIACKTARAQAWNSENIEIYLTYGNPDKNSNTSIVALLNISAYYFYNLGLPCALGVVISTFNT